MKWTNTAAIKLFLGVMIAAGCGALAAPATAAPRDLLVQSADNGLWLAQVLPDQAAENSYVTVIRLRSKTKETWTEISRLGGRVVSMAAQGTQLAVALDNGEWMLVWDGGGSLGQPIPAKGQIKMFAADSGQLWALAWVTGEFTPATTAPATQPAIERPTSKPANPRWVLLRLDGPKWTPVGDVPGPADAELAMVAARGKVVTAVKPAGESTQLFDENQPLGKIDNAPGSRLALLADENSFLLWSGGDRDAGELVRLVPQLPGGKLEAPTGLPPNADRAVAISTGRLRLFFTKAEQGKISVLEQKYDLKTRAKIDEPAALSFTVPHQQTESTFVTVFHAITLATLVFSVFLSFHHRTKMRDLLEREDHPVPAPLPGRLLAAVIDLLPIFGSFVVVQILMPTENDPMATMQDPRVNMIGGIGMAIYLLHTLLIETIFGRSIGKMIVGLKLIGLDGKPAGVWARLVRNLLRMIDVALFGLMIFSPLRQRIGDIVAGTLVVSSKKPAHENETGSSG